MCEDGKELFLLNPQDTEAFYNRALAYFDLSQPERAIQDYDEAIRLNPQDALAHAYALHGLAYTHLGKGTEAQKDIERAVGLGFDRRVLETEIAQMKMLR